MGNQIGVYCKSDVDHEARVWKGLDDLLDGLRNVFFHTYITYLVMFCMFEK